MSFAAHSVIALYAVAIVVMLLVILMAVARSVRLRRRTRTERIAAPLRPMLIRLMAADEIDEDALETLVRLPDSEWHAIEPRVFALLDKVRGRAAEAIDGLLRSRGAVARSLDETTSRGAVKRANAIVRLASLRRREYAGIFERMLQDADKDVRRAAAVGLGKVGRPESVAPLLGCVTGRRTVSPLVIGDALARIGPGAAETLAVMLKSGTLLQRKLAAEVLGRVGATSAETALAGAARTDPAEKVRATAVEALGKVGTWDAVDTLLDVAVADPAVPVRCAAIMALAEHSGTGVVATLERALGDNDYDIAHVAAYALTQLGLAGRDVLERAAARPELSAAGHATEALAAADLDEQLGRRATRRVLV